MKLTSLFARKRQLTSRIKAHDAYQDRLLLTDVESLESRQMLAGNVVTVFHAEDLFEAGTRAKAQPELANEGLVADTYPAGELTFSLGPDATELYVGRGANADWTTLTAGNDIALSGPEDLNIDIDHSVYSFGMTVVSAPSSLPTTSHFTVTMKTGSSVVGQFEMTPRLDMTNFVGFHSKQAFDRVEIRETGIDRGNDYFSEFSISSKRVHNPLGRNGRVHINNHNDISIHGTSGDDLVQMHEMEDLIGMTFFEQRGAVDGPTPVIDVYTEIELNDVRNLRVNLKAGNDFFHHIGSSRYVSAGTDVTTIQGRYQVNTGSGADTVGIDHVEVNGFVNINTGSGNDWLVIGSPSQAPAPKLRDRVKINLGSGNDNLSIDTDMANFRSTCQIVGGGGQDLVYPGERFLEGLGATVRHFEGDRSTFYPF